MGYLQAFAISSFLTKNCIQSEADSGCFILDYGDGFTSVFLQISRVGELATFGYLIRFRETCQGQQRVVRFQERQIRCKAPQTFTRDKT